MKLSIIDGFFDSIYEGAGYLLSSGLLVIIGGILSLIAGVLTYRKYGLFRGGFVMVLCILLLIGIWAVVSDD